MICQACDRRRGSTVGVCRSCARHERLVAGRCSACRLQARIEDLCRDADPRARAALAPYLDALARSPRPASTLRWLQPPTLALLEALLAGRIATTHRELDTAHEHGVGDQAVAFVRAALVAHGVLPERDEPSAAFARWQQTAINAVRDGPDRAHLRAYARWQVAHQLARTDRHVPAGRAAQKYARSLVTEAIKLTGWLHQQGLELRDLHQDLLETWITAGTSNRRRVRAFTAWLQRSHVTGTLDVAYPPRAASTPPLAGDRRWTLLRVLLHDDTIDPRDRLAGSLVVLYAQPVTRIAALRASDIHTTAHATTIALARGTVALPEPLDTLAANLRQHRSSTAGEDAWLFAGRHAGTHLSADRLRERLQTLGITSRPARHAALLALAARLPAPILAERLGIHPARAAQWARLAGAPYADYVALRHNT